MIYSGTVFKECPHFLYQNYDVPWEFTRDEGNSSRQGVIFQHCGCGKRGITPHCKTPAC
jgi:hypothetical protein